MDRKEEDFYSWHLGVIYALVVFVLFILVHTESFYSWAKESIPDKHTRTICIGLVLAAVMFLFVGLMTTNYGAVNDTTEQDPMFDNLSCFII